MTESKNATKIKNSIIDAQAQTSKNTNKKAIFLNAIWENSMIKSAVKRYVNSMHMYYGMQEYLPVQKNLDVDALYSAAFLGLSDAVDSFDLTKNTLESADDIVRFIAFAKPFMKSAMVENVLAESQQYYPLNTRYYQNKLINVKKSGVQLTDTNATIIAAVEDTYGYEWADNTVTRLKEVFTADTKTFEEQTQNLSTNPFEKPATKASGIVDTAKQAMKNANFSDKEMKAFQKWTELAMSGYNANEIRQALTEEENTIMKQQKVFLRQVLTDYAPKKEEKRQNKSITKRKRKASCAKYFKIEIEKSAIA